MKTLLRLISDQENALASTPQISYSSSTASFLRWQIEAPSS
jgi:hypothetical protein